MSDLLSKTFQTMGLHLKVLASAPLEGENHLYWVFFLSFAALGVYSYVHYYLENGRFSFGKFFRFLFPKDVYLHPSAFVDYQIFIANRFAEMLLRVLTIAVSAWLTARTGDLLAGLIGEPAARQEWTFPAMLLATLAMALATDFSSYFVHMLSHRIPALWEFHRVHHTAEVLTPITLFRKHPVYDALGGLIATPINGFVQGLLLYFFVGKVTVVSVFGANLIYSAFRFFGGNLRHSHIWLSWGPVLSRVFISPAQHQIHHSVDEKHLNKNYGEIFALWDWMFGSLYVPKEKEDLIFGVAKDTPQEYDTLLKAYWLPFANLGRMAVRLFGGNGVVGSG